MYTSKQTGKLLESYHSNIFGFGHRGVAKFFKGNYNAAVFLDHLIYKLNYWAEKDGLQPDGSFYYTVGDVEDTIFLTKRVQDGLIKKFVQLGLMTVTNRGVCNARHFKLNIDEIYSFLNECAMPVKKSRKPPTKNKLKKAKNKRYCLVRTNCSLIKKTTPKQHTNTITNSSSEEIGVKEENKMSSDRQQTLYDFCTSVVNMSKSQAKKTIRYCMQQGINVFTVEALREAYRMFKGELQSSGRIIVPHKYFANGIEIALTNLSNGEVVRRSENYVPFYNWLRE